MELSIVIVNWNTRDLLTQCLDSIYAHPPDCEFAIWVVDNASSDGSAQMVGARFPNVRLIKNRENLGFARANNQALRASTGLYLLLLNPDTEVSANALTQLVKYLQNHPKVGIAGANLINADGTYQSSFASFPTLLSELLNATGLMRWFYRSRISIRESTDNSQVQSVDWVSGACLLVRRQAFEEVGLLDEEYFLYGEEMDWCYRMKRHGWQVSHLPSARVIHLEGQSSKLAGRKKMIWLAQSHLRFMTKYRGWLWGRIFALIWHMASAAKAVLWLGIGCAIFRRRTWAWERAQAHWLVARSDLLSTATRP
jgi:GT2 family glycosyltransferase